MSFDELIGVIVYDYLWGTPLVVFILGSGLYLTIRSGLFQFRFFGSTLKQVYKNFFGKEHSGDEGLISPLEAISTALGSTIGTGNIGGVATAIVTGGPGAVFWMWIAGLFGMIIKMAEISMAVFYREKDFSGEPHGGPTYYMKKGLGEERGWTRFANVLRVLFVCGFFTGYFINLNTYESTSALATTIGVNQVPVAIIYSVVLIIMVCGGLKRVGRWCSLLVPFMCILYIGGGLFIIFKDPGELGGLFGTIFDYAFNAKAAFGGFAGATVVQALKVGMARSVNSNEAGWGTAPMIHASAQTDHPIKQGMIGIFEVFVDTFIVCTITALVIIKSGLWSSGLDGAALSLSAFEIGIGTIGRLILACGVFLFGLTTATGIYFQSEVLFRDMIKNEKVCMTIIWIYRILYPVPAFGTVLLAVYGKLPGTTLWTCVDMCTVLPVLTNVLTLLILSPCFFTLVRDYKARAFGIGQVNEREKIFYHSA